MKVGFVFECGPQGADKQVCEHLARRINPEIEPVSATLDNKDKLLKGCGEAAARLLAGGCERVLIVWDLRPAWPQKKEKPCRHAEREAILADLERAGVGPDNPVYLICIEQELESWLLADSNALSDYLSRETHAYRIKKVQKPDCVPNPKGVVIGHFKNAGRPRYSDVSHALKVVQEETFDFAKLEKHSPSFARFRQKLTGT